MDGAFHFIRFYSPALLLFDFNSFLMLELDNFQNILDVVFICSRIDLLGINISGMRYVAITILFFVTSLYKYKISLPEIAPRIIYTCAMLTRQKQQEQRHAVVYRLFILAFHYYPRLLFELYSSYYR
jgi:hypothetical protein